MDTKSSDLITDLIELSGENPESVLPVVKEYVNKYKPFIYGLLHQILDIYKDYSNNTEYPEIIAKIKRNKYDAYVNAGFTEDQAFALLIYYNLQLLKNIQKYSIKTSNSSIPSRNN